MELFFSKEDDKLSELLTDSAPDSEDAAYEVPSEGLAVEEGSGVSEAKVVAAERFNGLMSKFNKTQTELDSERQYRIELETRLQDLEARTNDIKTEEHSMTDVSGLQSQVEMLTQMLAHQQVESVRKDVLTQYPDIEPFIDLIEAPDVDAFRGLANTLNERIQIMKNVNAGVVVSPYEESVEQAPVAIEPVQTPIVEPPIFGGGSGAMAPAEGSEDRISEAIKNRDFGAFMRAKTEQTSSELEL